MRIVVAFFYPELWVNVSTNHCLIEVILGTSECGVLSYHRQDGGTE